MIILASSSSTRAKILSEVGIEFRQMFFEFDESGVSKTLDANSYVQSVVKAKKEQFLRAHPGLKNILFADSCVVCDGEILGKPRNGDDAWRMLKMQSENVATIVTAMIFLGEKFELTDVSATSYEFAKFDEVELGSYIMSGECMDKAGAMMVEGFDARYVRASRGLECTARGLNVEILKAFL